MRKKRKYDEDFFHEEDSKYENEDGEQKEGKYAIYILFDLLEKHINHQHKKSKTKSKHKKSRRIKESEVGSESSFNTVRNTLVEHIDSDEQISIPMPLSTSKKPNNMISPKFGGEEGKIAEENVEENKRNSNHDIQHTNGKYRSKSAEDISENISEGRGLRQRIKPPLTSMTTNPELVPSLIEHIVDVPLNLRSTSVETFEIKGKSKGNLYKESLPINRDKYIALFRDIKINNLGRMATMLETDANAFKFQSYSIYKYIYI